MPKVTKVVQSAIQRELRRAASSSPRLIQTTSAPNSGRKVTTERMGQVVMALASRSEHEPGDQPGHTDQHRKRVVIEIAGLDLDDVACDVEHASRYAVRPEAVDHIAVAELPEEAADGFRRPHEDQIVQLVEIPFVEQEFIQHRLLRGEILG